MERLKNKVAVITGGNSGMGLATAKLFAAEGAKVAITGRNEETLKEAVSELGHHAIGVKADVLNLKSIDNAYTEIAARHGKFDVLIINAGIYKGLPLANFTEELF